MATLRASLQANTVNDTRRTEQPTQLARRRQSVVIREENEACAMNSKRRCKAKVMNLIRRFCFCHRQDSFYSNTKKLDRMCEGGTSDEVNDVETGDETERPQKQYRLEAKREKQKISWKKRILSVITCGSSSDFGLSSRHHWVSSWMHWMFRIHLLFAFFFMCVVYFSFSLAFAGLIVVAGVMNKECIRLGTYDFGSFGSRFYDAFYLSWTTFATVGYGSIYPALSNQNNDRANCAFISALASFEALIGILYTGFCGAILFAKVLSIRNVAMVAFSDPVVIRYGSGVEDEHMQLFEHEHLLDLSKSTIHKHPPGAERAAGESKENRALPCPVLEFRIASLVWDRPNGVYIDARLNVVANVDAKDADPSVRDALDPEIKWKRTISAVIQTIRRTPPAGSSHSDTATESTGNLLSASSETTPSNVDSSQTSEFYEMYASVHGDSSNGSDEHDPRHHSHWIPHLFQRQSSSEYSQSLYNPHHDHRTLDEDPTSTLVTKRILSKMHLESTDHPYFQRVWLARHILDEHSPLLTPRVRRLIKRNHGNWPEELDSFEGVRNSLKFNQIIVSFQGVCNVTATTCYSQKIYDHNDINVGYQFADMLMSGDDGEVLVDIDKLNHVREQNGGGGEPLMLHSDDIA